MSPSPPPSPLSTPHARHAASLLRARTRISRFCCLVGCIGVTASLLGYALPRDPYMAIARILYLDYVDHLPVLSRTPVVENMHRFGGAAYFILGAMQVRMACVRGRVLTSGGLTRRAGTASQPPTAPVRADLT